MVLDILNSVAEDYHSVPGLAVFGQAGPVRMLGSADESLGMWHQAQHASGPVRQSRDGIDRAVRIDRKRSFLPFRIDITKSNISFVLNFFKCGWIVAYNFSFPI